MPNAKCKHILVLRPKIPTPSELVKSRRGKTGGSGQVNRAAGQVNRAAGQVRSIHIFQKKNFFFQLQKQINDNLFRENE